MTMTHIILKAKLNQNLLLYHIYYDKIFQTHLIKLAL